MTTKFRIMVAFTVLMSFTNIPQSVFASGTHPSPHSTAKKDHDNQKNMMEIMRERHSDHEHGHDFEAMENMSPGEQTRVVALLQDVGLVVPRMDAANGRKLFVETGCVVCHSVNGVGGDIGPSLNASDMPVPMNAFEFAARMWRGAAAMSAMQQDVLGEVISLNGQQLANLIAFAHDKKEQEKLTKNQISEKFLKLLDE